MKRLGLLVAASLLLVGAMAAPRPAAAVGIRCYAAESVGPSQGMVCRTVCIVCEDQDNQNAELARECYDAVCWFGFREV